MSTLTPSVSPELKTLMRKLKLGQLLDTLPERLALAKSHDLGHAEFLEQLFSDEAMRRDADSAVQTQTIKSIHLEKRYSFELMDIRACSWDPSATQHLVCQMFGDEEIRPSLAHCRTHRWRKFDERMLIIVTATK